tara:strand:- start:22769 stop:23878 length:1110 start_codon:yes stop_codon:yes gene_type:complete
MQLFNPSSEELSNAISARSENFLDVIVPFNELQCVNNDEIVSFTYNLGTAQFSEYAFRQLLTRVQLSSSYWRRLQAWDANELMVDNFNFCNEATANEISHQKRNNEPSYLFRLNPTTPIEEEEETEDEENGESSLITPVRAVLSATYSVFDDDQLFFILMNELDQNDNSSYSLYEYDDHITRLHIKFEDTQVVHSEGEDNEVTYSAGMIISNSEVGCSSIWIEPVVYRNDAVFVNRTSLTKQNVDMKIVHRGNIDSERILQMLETCSEVAQVGIVQLEEAFNKKIDPKYALTFMQTIIDFPNRMALILHEDWEHEEDLKQAEVANAILEMAQSLPLFQRTKVEQAAGRMIGLFDNYQNRMEQIIEDINN